MRTRKEKILFFGEPWRRRLLLAGSSSLMRQKTVFSKQGGGVQRMSWLLQYIIFVVDVSLQNKNVVDTLALDKFALSRAPG